LKIKHPNLLTKSIEVFIETNTHQSLFYLKNTSLEDLCTKIENESVDFIISRAVLEHVENPQLCLSNMHNVLKKGGRMIHEIDFRDHGMFESYNLHPLTMLIFPEKTWKRATNNLGAPNRHLLPFYENILKKLDYSFEVTVVHTVFSDKKLHLRSFQVDSNFKHQLQQIELYKHKLSKPYCDYKSEQLLVSAAIISAVKN
jgi:SAM-dependent methyltransferase